ncbi:MAG: hypothetical protein Q7U04_09745 [Bacteriovorax sp.]|nr:hypothetical protein [Bacteriovorax sp.]
MIHFPFISLPEHFTRLLASNIQNSTQTNNNLELYINDNKELNALVRKIFRDIDPDGFLGKIISISGWAGIRNRLAAVYLEYAMTGRFPETANLSLVTDIINIENKLRHFTPTGYSRTFLFGFYAKMSLIHVKKSTGTISPTPLIIRDEHFEFMKISKGKSVRVDWLMLQLIQYDHFLGTERMNTLLQTGSRYETLFALLSADEQKEMIDNCMAYGASIFDQEIFLTDVAIQS